jgi:hypothetical protein
MNNEGLFEPALSNFVDPTTKLDGVFWDNNDWFVLASIMCFAVMYIISLFIITLI